MNDYKYYISHQKSRKDRIKDAFCYLLSGVLLAGLIGITMHGCIEATVQEVENRERYGRPQLTAEQMEYREFFRRHGSPVPDQMAVAVTSTKRPALMAAIAVVESNGTPDAVGDAGKAHGAFQVWPDHWGPVPSDPAGQAAQAERILDALVESRGDLRRGLAAYNGGTTPPRVAYRYAERVLALSKGVQP